MRKLCLHSLFYTGKLVFRFTRKSGVSKYKIRKRTENREDKYRDYPGYFVARIAFIAKDLNYNKAAENIQKRVEGRKPFVLLPTEHKSDKQDDLNKQKKTYKKNPAENQFKK